MQLSEPQPGQYEPSNLFAVIIDFPVVYSNGDKHMLNLKVIDPSLNQKASNIVGPNQNQSNNVFAAFSFFANDKLHLPQVNRIGDIIRVQKSNCKNYKGQKQFNINVYANRSEWAIFEGNVDNQMPIDELISCQNLHTSDR